MYSLMALGTVTCERRGQVMGNTTPESWRMEMSVMRDRVEGGLLVGTRKAEF